LGIETETFRFVSQCLNHYTTACPLIKIRQYLNIRVNISI
jgi:hypothetical protein